ncbi:MAG: hypothetical protein K0Q91_2315 [Fibrobacteria bacterium]|nr:hypothetical protein [Fibrobacteria bacterium]
MVPSPPTITIRDPVQAAPFKLTAGGIGLRNVQGKGAPPEEFPSGDSPMRHAPNSEESKIAERRESFRRGAFSLMPGNLRHKRGKCARCSLKSFC